MTNSFDQIIDRRNSDSIKWNLHNEDILPLWVADMDFKSPQPVIDAMINRVEHGVFGYPHEDQQLKIKIVERMKLLYNWDINSEDIIFIPGVVPSFNLACRALTKPKDSVIIQTPVYPPFFKAPENAGLEKIENPLVKDEDGQYKIDFVNFQAQIKDSTSLYILCNPHNPVGRVFTGDELQKLANICIENNIIICSDEIHCDLVFSGHRHIPIASLDEEIAQNSITLMAPSKTYNIAGIGCSFIIAQNPDIRNKLLTHMTGITGHVNIFGYTAALAAYENGNDWLDAVMQYLEQNRNYVYDFVKHELPGISMILPEATYLAWLDCRELNSKKDPYQLFLEDAKVALNNGITFGEPGKDFVRLNFGCPREILEESLRRIRSVI